ncbi:hypothetical protein HZS_5157 [Henneguya salminicola]|nr:hypothetical protein HZS_5157 [Henneguya salminicola]
MSELFDIFTKLDHLINFVFSSNPLFENSKNLAIIYAINNCHDDYKNRGLQNIMAKYLHDALTQNRDFISIMHSQNHFSAFLRVLDWLENLTTFTLCHLDYLIMRQAQNISTLSIEKIIIKLFDSKINEKLTIEINGRFVQLEQSSKPNNLFFSSHKNSNNLKFNFLVLNSNLWNLTHYCDVSQSQEIGVFNKEFSSWYSRKFHGQHVQYLDQYSRSTLSLTLLTLVKEKLLSSSPHTNEDNFSSILADTRFKINLNFHQDKNNIEIPNPLDYKAEPTVVEDNNERVINYTMSIQAAIVKIMKTKKNLDKNLLINDIFECLKGLEITPKMVAYSVVFL